MLIKEENGLTIYPLTVKGMGSTLVGDMMRKTMIGSSRMGMKTNGQSHFMESPLPTKHIKTQQL